MVKKKSAVSKSFVLNGPPKDYIKKTKGVAKNQGVAEAGDSWKSLKRGRKGSSVVSRLDLELATTIGSCKGNYSARELKRLREIKVAKDRPWPSRKKLKY